MLGKKLPSLASAWGMLRVSVPAGTGRWLRNRWMSLNPLHSWPSMPSKNLLIASSLLCASGAWKNSSSSATGSGSASPESTGGRTSGGRTDSRRAASRWAPRKPAIWTAFSLVLPYTLLYCHIPYYTCIYFVRWSISLYWEGTSPLIRFDGHLYDFGDPMLWYTSVFSFNSGGGLSKRKRGKFANTEIYS